MTFAEIACSIASAIAFIVALILAALLGQLLGIMIMELGISIMDRMNKSADRRHRRNDW